VGPALFAFQGQAGRQTERQNPDRQEEIGMLLKVRTGEKTWAIFELSDHISFGYDIRYGWCSFPEGAGGYPNEEIGLCVFHDMMSAWVPLQEDDGRWLKMTGEPSFEDYAVLDGDSNHKVKTKVRRLNWLVDEGANKIYLFDAAAYILNNDGKTIERL
jgi:hypothetical protein